MNLPPSLTLSPGGAHFAQVLLRQKLGQVLDHPRCLSWSLLFPLALDSAVEWGMEALLWGVPAATAVFLPITAAPGQVPCELLGLSGIFQHISFPGKQNRLAERADGKGQAVYFYNFLLLLWLESLSRPGWGFSIASQGKEMDAGAPPAPHFGWTREQARRCRGRRSFTVPGMLPGFLLLPVKRGRR